MGAVKKNNANCDECRMKEHNLKKKSQKRKLRAAAEKKRRRETPQHAGISRYSEINKNQKHEPKVKIKLAELCREYAWGLLLCALS